MAVTDGVGRASEDEDTVEPHRARKYISDPSLILRDGIELVQNVTRCVVLEFLPLTIMVKSDHHHYTGQHRQELSGVSN
jgi:hypothetical protein